MIRLKNRTVLSVLLLSLIIVGSGCVPQDSGFSGGGGRAAEVKPPPPKTDDQKPESPETPTPAPQPASCTAARLDSVRSLTAFVDQRTYQNATVRLELNFTPCPTQLAAVQLPIMFDIDGDTMYGDEFDQKLSYEVYVGGVRTSGPGSINSLRGRDLFGKVGETYGYFQSDGALSASPSTTRAELIIKFRTLLVLGPANSGVQATSNFTIPMYVKVGQSPPVKVNVTFTPAVVPA